MFSNLLVPVKDFKMAKTCPKLLMLMYFTIFCPFLDIKKLPNYFYQFHAFLFWKIWEKCMVAPPGGHSKFQFGDGNTTVLSRANGGSTQRTHKEYVFAI